MKENSNGKSYIKEILESAGTSRLLTKKTIWLVSIALAVLLTGAAVLYASTGNSKAQHRTSVVKKGDLTVTVTATGTLQPVEQVEVGTEVSGTIKTVMVDYNNKVKKGQVLAKLDTTKLEAQILQSEATLSFAKAKLLEAQATVSETQSKLNRFKESLELSGGKVPSRTELDSAEAAFKRAQAQEASGRADIAKAEAVLKANRSDLAKATITSPINGVVLERKVEPGQTVAASLQTPLLFKLAEDLRQMELRIFVDEADVGQVKEGQTAVFTVDAFPDRKFPARVKQARFAPRTENNVVTYETILEVDNTDMLLRPGMTATAFITVNSVANAVLIPNAALRFSPPQDKSQKQDSGGNTLLASLLNRRPPGNNMRQKQQKQDEMPTIWKVDGESLACVPVKLGVTDGMMTQIVEGDVEPGAVIATDTVKAKQ